MKIFPKLLAALCLMAAATLMASTAARADSFQIGVGPNGGINFSLTTGGYCDAGGCPDAFWDMPVYYCPVYYHGRWYRGPVYYRHTPDGLRFWIRGAWRSDRWHGPRPPWACTNRMGPPLGFRYYERHGFHMRPEWRDRWNRDHPSHPPRDLRHGHDRGPGPDMHRGKSPLDHIMGKRDDRHMDRNDRRDDHRADRRDRDDRHMDRNRRDAPRSAGKREDPRGAARRDDRSSAGKRDDSHGKKDVRDKKNDKDHGDKKGNFRDRNR